MENSRIGSSHSSTAFYRQTQAGESSQATNSSEAQSHSRVSSWLSQNSLRPMTGRDWAEQSSRSGEGSRRIPQASAHYESATVQGLSELGPSSLTRSDTRTTTAGMLGSRRLNFGGSDAHREFGASMRSDAGPSYSDLKQRERINKAAEQTLELSRDGTYGAATQTRLSEGQIPKLVQQKHKIPESDIPSVISTFNEMASEKSETASGKKSKSSSSRSSWWRR